MKSTNESRERGHSVPRMNGCKWPYWRRCRRLGPGSCHWAQHLVGEPFYLARLQAEYDRRGDAGDVAEGGPPRRPAKNNNGAERAEREHDVYRSEHRVRRVDNGQITWVRAAGRFLYDDDGRPGRFVWVFFDITERKKVEQALRKSEDGLRSFAQELEMRVV